MADEAPTYYNVGPMSEGGITLGDIAKALLDIEAAIHAICNNLDEDSTGAADYLAKIGTDLRTSFANLRRFTPAGGART